MNPVTPTQLRILASLCAATLGVGICLYQQHFTLSFSDPHSFAVMTTHRCGLCMLFALTWMLAETSWACLRPVGVNRPY